MEFILLVVKVLGVLAVIVAIETFPAYLGRKKVKGRKKGSRDGITESNEASKSNETDKSSDSMKTTIDDSAKTA